MAAFQEYKFSNFFKKCSFFNVSNQQMQDVMAKEVLKARNYRNPQYFYSKIK